MNELEKNMVKLVEAQIQLVESARVTNHNSSETRKAVVGTRNELKIIHKEIENANENNKEANKTNRYWAYIVGSALLAALGIRAFLGTPVL